MVGLNLLHLRLLHRVHHCRSGGVHSAVSLAACPTHNMSRVLQVNENQMLVRFKETNGGTRRQLSHSRQQTRYLNHSTKSSIIVCWLAWYFGVPPGYLLIDYSSCTLQIKATHPSRWHEFSSFAASSTGLADSGAEIHEDEGETLASQLAMLTLFIRKQSTLRLRCPRIRH